MRSDRPWLSRNALAVSAVAVLTVSVLAACSGSSRSGPSGSATSSSHSTAPIVIGASLSLTGDFAADGQTFDKGYQLWVKDVNARGGLLGRPVKLTFLNDNRHRRFVPGEHSGQRGYRALGDRTRWA